MTVYGRVVFLLVVAFFECCGSVWLFGICLHQGKSMG